MAVVLLLTLAGCGDAGGSGDAITLHITPAATRTSTPPILPTLAPTTYKVKPGDTLSGIATLFGITTDELIRANSISDPDRVGEGQELIIPARSQNTSDKETIGAPAASPTPALPPPDVTPPMGP